MPEPTLSPSASTSELIVEVAMRNNGCLIFSPLGNERLRGRWDNRYTAGRSGDAIGALAACAFYPGIRLGVDLKSGTTRRFDPLDTKEFATELRTLNNIAKEFPQMFGASRVKPHPEHIQWPNDETPDQTATRLKNWLFWIRRAHDAGKLLVVAGSLPSMEEIRKMPGSRLRKSSAISGARGGQEVDTVPLRGKQAA